MKTVLSEAVTLRRSRKRDIEPSYADGRIPNFDKHTGEKISRCDVCHIWFVTTRSHAKFCTPNCRKAHSRRKDKFKRECAKMHTAIRSVRHLFQQWPDLEEFMIDEIRGAIEM